MDPDGDICSGIPPVIRTIVLVAANVRRFLVLLKIVDGRNQRSFRALRNAIRD